MISCQISFIPMGTERINHQVDQVLKIMDRSGLKYEIGGMSTVMTGEREEITGVIDAILEYAAKETVFVLDVRYSNQCGLK